MSYWYQRVRDWTLQLVGFASVTNTRGETEFAQRLYDLLAELPYFKAHPDQLWLERTADDLRERYNLFALVRGGGPATVVLSGHYDVVSIDNYGPLAPWAFDPEALLPRLIADLEAHCRSESDHLALHDLKSGVYLPGRGVLDMKSGLAAGIAVLCRFSEIARERQGSLLLIATPDEEDSSHGMRSAALRLGAIAHERQLDLDAAINLDATNDRGDGSVGQAIFLGTVGKLLPLVYVVGRDTHAGVPFDGVNANLLAAEITRRIECNAALSDVVEGAAAPPPVSLKQSDLKTQYDVTTPAAAWCYYNVLTHGRAATDVLDTVMGLVREALDSALQQLQEQARRYAALAQQPIEPIRWQPLVLSFAELQARVRQQCGPEALHALDELALRLAQDPAIDLPSFNRRLIEAWWSHSGLSGPAAVVGFGSLYYPPSYVKGSTERQRRVRDAAAQQAAALSHETAVPIQLRPFFSGISDMSFLGSATSAEDVAAIASNTPAWEARLRFDYAAVSALDLPTINIGPWGRDYHQRLERVHMPYSFEVLPELIWRVAGRVLEQCALEEHLTGSKSGVS
ncbi:MAG TPA: M20/M25/M40 family metallo-hydrolase [Herpetosiphonaceae bacterium]